MTAKCCVPQRALLALMLFTACAISYMLRVNMSISIIAMAKEQTQNNTKFVPTCEARKILENITTTTPSDVDVQAEKLERLTIDEELDDDDEDLTNKRYDWDQQTQFVILGAYFWGQIVSCAPGGLVAERFGATKTVFVSTVVAAVCTLLIPLGAMVHWGAVWGLRFVAGLMGGVIYPSLHCLISRWAPPDEKGKFIGALLGGSLGTVLTWPLLGVIIDKWGWPCSFFIPAAVAIVWSVLWFFSVADSPAESKTISKEEIVYIEESLKGVGSNEKVLPPYRQIFTSIPVYAFIICHFGNSWGLYFLMTSGPKYMSTVLGFNLGSSGFLSAMPYLARMLFGFVFGLIGDIIRRNAWISTTTMRKSFTLCSHIIPGVFLLLLTATECDVIWTITLITMSLGVNGASSITNLANSQDLAPAFAGSLYGIANTVGGTTGFISPAITGYFTKEHNGIDQWRTVFHIGGSVYIVSGLIFILFGSGENQNFNVKTVDKPEKKGVENTAYQNDEEAKDTTTPI